MPNGLDAFVDALRHAEASPAAGSTRRSAAAAKPAALSDQPRRWVFVNEDQLSDQLEPLRDTPPRELGIVLVEHRWRAALRPLHRARLVFIWANQRHFAIEQARRGVEVRYLVSQGPLADTLAPAVRELGPMLAITPAERETRAELAPLVSRGGLTLVPHTGWLTTAEHFHDSQRRAADRRDSPSAPPWKMDSFYRHVRRLTGVLMEPDGSFTGGKVSFDTENRRPWRPPGRTNTDTPAAPTPPRFEHDALTREVAELVATHWAHHPGVVDLDALPTTAQHAHALWRWAREHCLPHFGPYEDAMSLHSRTLFHTRISGVLNLHRLLPAQIVSDAAALDIPLASKEGFIRQILGWREFVRHVHEATDGFRAIPGSPAAAQPPAAQAPADTPGDAGFSRWAGRRWSTAASLPADLPAALERSGIDGGARPAALGSATPLPPAYWGTPSGLRCLDETVVGVWADAWSHHITRLMVLSNIATLLDVLPRELTDWFWVAYLDAWDWVVEPNVLGMGTYAVGGVMTTKPYIAGSAYIDKMSDYCSACQFDPKSTCPITRLYWAFLARHEPKLQSNPRLFMPMNALRKRPAEARAADDAVFRTVTRLLVNGQPLTPAALANTSPPATASAQRRSTGRSSGRSTGRSTGPSAGNPRGRAPGHPPGRSSQGDLGFA